MAESKAARMGAWADLAEEILRLLVYTEARAHNTYNNINIYLSLLFEH